MKAKTIWLSITVILFIVAIFLIVVKQSPASELDEFAQCLTENNAVFYGAFWCSHCNTQKSLFGDSIKKVTYIECSTPDQRGQLPICVNEQIMSYPTWKINGEVYGGVLSINELSQLTGCKV
jgi:hypothetical protein|tara:strand:+ start:2790 stop:3155 length:366 start_codon:yes stop_codon:yes gene_type:complete